MHSAQYSGASPGRKRSLTAQRNLPASIGIPCCTLMRKHIPAWSWWQQGNGGSIRALVVFGTAARTHLVSVPRRRTTSDLFSFLGTYARIPYHGGLWVVVTSLHSRASNKILLRIGVPISSAGTATTLIFQEAGLCMRAAT